MNKRGVLKNYVYHMIYQIVAMLVVVLSIPYISRVLGPDKVGVYSYSYANVSYFVLLSNLGLNWYGEREIAFKLDNLAERSKVFFQVMILKIITFTVSVLAYFIYVKLSSVSVIISLLQGIVLVATIFDISWLFRGIEDFKSITIWQSTLKVFGLIAMFLFVRSEKDLLVYIIIQGLVTLVPNVILWGYLSRYVQLKYIKQVSIFHDYRVILEMSIPGIAVQIYNVLDKTMLGLIKQNMTQSGYYEQVGKIVTVTIVMITSISTVMAPNVAKHYSNGDTDYVSEAATKTYKFVMFLAYALSFGLVAVANVFVPIFLGKKFEGATPLLVAYSFLIIIISLSNVAGNVILTPIKRHNKGTIAVVSGATINFGLNLIFIPRYAAMGAVVATIIAEIAVTIIHLVYSKDIISLKKLFVENCKFLIGGITMLALIYILDHGIFSRISINNKLLLVVEVAVGAIAYIGIVLLFFGKKIFKELVAILKND